MKILVTGGAGFIGSHLVDKLIEQGHDVSVVDNLSSGARENLNAIARFYELDIRDPKIALVFEKEKPEAVFHLAAQVNVRKSEENPYEDTLVNAVGGLNVLKNSLKYGVKKFIFTSTGGALYGETPVVPTTENHTLNPISVYGKNKLFFERMLEFYHRVSGLDYSVLRFANIYGPRQNFGQEAGVVAIFINKLLAGEAPVVYGDGEQTRDFVYVDDAVRALASLLAYNKARATRRAMPYAAARAIFNVGTGQEISVNDLFQRISKHISSGTLKPKYKRAKRGELRRSALSGHRIKEVLGFEPKYDFDEGLKKTIEWFRACV